MKGLLVMVAALILCQAPQERAEAKVKVSKVTVKSNYGKMVHVAVGKKVKLTTTVKVKPNKAANKKVTYKSSNKKIATVTAAGYVKGKKTGTCKVTVRSKKNKKKKAKITVKVVKKVTSISIEEPKASLYVGNSVKLKATVKPASGSFKKVKWSSSDKSVATVSSTGVVNGLKEGTVTIKATSVEGSKKTASVKLTVLAVNSVGLSSVEVLSENVVRVVLDKAKVLTEKQFLIEGKRYSFGAYTRQYTIDQLRNYDNRTYDITLNPDYTIERDSFVRVTISDLPGNGVKTKETQAIFIRATEPQAVNWIGVVGDTWEKEIDLSEYCYGNISYTVAGSIPGVTVKAKNNSLVFSGTLTTVTVRTDLMITALDEMGSSVTQTVHAYVGNESMVVAKAEDLTAVAGSEWTEKEFAAAAGGSGQYTFSAINMPAGLTLDAETGTLSGEASGVGEYEVQLTVTDQENASRSFQTTARIRVVEQRKVTGTVLDSDGKPVADAVITCENLSDGSIYITTTDAAGMYTLYVGEGSYNMTAVFEEASDAVYQIAVGSGGRQINYKLDLAR